MFVRRDWRRSCGQAEYEGVFRGRIKIVDPSPGKIRCTYVWTETVPLRNVVSYVLIDGGRIITNDETLKRSAGETERQPS